MKRFAFLIAIILTSAAFEAASQEKKDASAPRHLPGGGVADPAAKVGFFPNTMGGIDALDLATGKLLWASKDADRPLLASDERLFAQTGKTNQVRVIMLDTRNGGKRILESEAIKLADWVSIQTTLGRSFRSGARADAKNLWLSWEAQAFYAGGAAPTPEIEQAARKNASGVARIDLETGKVEALSAEQVAAGKLGTFPTGTIVSKVGVLTLMVNDTSAKNPKNPFEMRRTLQAMNEAKEVVWQRDIAAPIFLPPPP